MIQVIFQTVQNYPKLYQSVRKEINRNAITIGQFLFCHSNISKLIEKLLYNRLHKFLNQNKCLFNYQFGFWNHHSTNHELISITEKIRNALAEGKFACGVFLDFQKAFDTVNHKILISKLEHYGIRGLPLHLFQNYLEKRTQFVNINKKAQMYFQYKSQSVKVLGLLLFLIYINDLNGISNFSKIHNFAEDTNILYASNSLKDIKRLTVI